LGANLTRDEARERAALITVSSYQVDLDLTGGDDVFDVSCVIRFTCAFPGASTFVDFTGSAVRRIVLNGSPVDTGTGDGDRIALTGLAATNTLEIEATCAYSRSGEGLHRFADPVDERVYLYSDLETYDAHRVYPCFDQPDMKATFEFSVTAPASWTVVSNMAADSAEPAGTRADVTRWRFPATPPMATYFTAVAAGPYHVVRDEHDGIPLGIFCRQSLAQYLDPDEIFTVTKQGFDFFHNAFGIKYSFGKYDQLFVPEFKEGAMENAGCVTLLEDYIFRSRVTDSAREDRAGTILHEMAHMWFGDLVTMRWWDDLWLNESFATWAGTLAEAEATRWSLAWTTFAQLYKAWAYRQDQLPSTHPIAADIPDIHAVEVNFDGITYAKGASVLKQLVAYVGRENFLDGVRRYFAAHAFGNATLADLLSALEETSGRDLTSWSAEWLETAGVNTLRPEYEVDANGRFTSFAVIQSAAPEHPTLRSHRIAIGLYDLNNDGLTCLRRIEVDIAGSRTPIPDLVGELRPDLVLVNDEDLTYAKIRLDPHSLATLVSSIGLFGDPLPAVLCWAAAWDMCRDGEMATRDYVRLIMAGVPSVTDSSVRQTLLRQAGLAVRRFADPSWRPAGLSFMASWLRSLVLEAAPGTDEQLAYAHAFTSVAFSPADLDLVAGLLDGSVVLEGLAVDTELRWTLLGRLVSRGVLGPDAIDYELARDATDAGERNAAACRAAIPVESAKRAAWELLTSGSLTIAMFRAVMGGFVDLDHPELIEPYREAYFGAVGEVWRTWSSAMAQNFVSGLFGVCALSTETVAAADRYLSDAAAGDSMPDALRRLLTEGRDDVLRALRCQERDRQASTGLVANVLAFTELGFAELGEQAQQRVAQRLELRRAGQLGPVLFHAPGGRVRDRRDRRAAFGEKDQPGAMIARVRLALDVPGSLKLVHRLGHRLLAHVSQLGEPRHRDAFRRHEREHVRCRRANIVEPGLAQGGIDVVGVVLVDQPKQQPDQGLGRKSRIHR
jgi:aminopeptidase N